MYFFHPCLSQTTDGLDLSVKPKHRLSVQWRFPSTPQESPGAPGPDGIFHSKVLTGLPLEEDIPHLVSEGQQTNGVLHV